MGIKRWSYRMKEETFESFKAKVQKKYPKEKLMEENTVINGKTVIKLFGYCERIDGKKGMGLVGAYYKKP